MATLDDLVANIEDRFSETANMFLQHDQLTLEIDPGDLLLCCKILRDENDFKFEQLLDVCGVDFLDYGVGEWATDAATTEGFSRARDNPSDTDVSSPPSKGAELRLAARGVVGGPRFAVVYQLLSLTHNHRLRLRVYTRGEPPTVPSVVKVWPSANWYEREAFDLFGIHFDDHPDLRRILTDYNFVGHPFRKDFPLIGHVEMRYDAAQAKCIYEPVSIAPRTLVPKIIRHVNAGTK